MWGSFYEVPRLAAVIVSSISLVHTFRPPGQACHASCEYEVHQTFFLDQGRTDLWFSGPMKDLVDPRKRSLQPDDLAEAEPSSERNTTEHGDKDEEP